MIATLLRVASCRFAAIYVVGFSAGLLGIGGNPAWIAFGAPYWLLFSLATELVNRLSDQVEDAVNRPERTALCNAVGYDRIARLSVIAWTAVVALDAVWIVVRPSWPLAGLLLVAAFASISYSYGLRLKRARFFSLLLITFPFCGTFFTGWAVYAGSPGATDALTHRYIPFSLFLGWFVGTLAGVKDVTDALGDEAIGYRSMFLSIARSQPSVVIAAILAIPFALLWAFVAIDLLPVRFGWLTVFWPLSVVVARCAMAAGTQPEREATREVAYQYWIVFLSAAFMTFEPSGTMLAVVAGSLAYWTATSQLLHWSDGMRWWKLAVLPKLFLQRGPVTRREVST
jgi:4-hydroxybenzoate polyprenyltransferase